MTPLRTADRIAAYVRIAYPIALRIMQGSSGCGTAPLAGDTKTEAEGGGHVAEHGKGAA